VDQVHSKDRNKKLKAFIDKIKVQTDSMSADASYTFASSFDITGNNG